MSTRRESRYVRFAKLAYEIALETFEPYTHVKSKHVFTQPQLASCVLVMFYLDLSYRDMEEWLLASSEVVSTLRLKRIPDHTTLCRMFKRMTLAKIRRMASLILARLKPSEIVIALDSTGFRADQASAYYQLRCGQERKEWIKGAYAVGTESLLIVSAGQGMGRDGDSHFLRPLRQGAAQYAQPGWLLLADAGFDCIHTHSDDLIPPIRRHGKIVAPERKARADLVAQARLEGVYGQRWMCETVHSVMKRLSGDSVRSRKTSLQRREPVLKGLVYNLHVW